MQKITICTFNVENLFLRYKFTPLPPGIISKRALKADIVKGFGYLPSVLSSKSYNLYKEDARIITALSLTRGNTIYPDICCLQEIESMQALRIFNATQLNKKYTYAFLIDSHDPRLIDIGILSLYPISKIVSHIDEKDDRGYYLFSRDCLEVTFDIKGKSFTFFVNHLKSKCGSPKDKGKSDKRRKQQAERVSSILKDRFSGKKYNSEAFAVLGDFNDSPDSDAVSPLVKNAGLENIIRRLPEQERWTHWWASKNLVSQLDYILLSPALSKKSQELPAIERRGLSSVKKKSYFALPDDKKWQEVDFTFERFKGVTDEIDASDHCPVFFTLNL